MTFGDVEHALLFAQETAKTEHLVCTIFEETPGKASNHMEQLEVARFEPKD